MDPSGRRRPRYFEGRLLSADDLTLEQEYHREMRHLQNRILGSGIVEGLTLSIDDDTITVSPGLALDVLGREIVLTEPFTLLAGKPSTKPGASSVITAAWEQVEDGPVPGDDAAEPPHFLYWLERPRISLEAPAKVAPPMLILGVLQRTKRQGLTIDETSRDRFRKRRYPRA
jgi:hypothetical protein